MEQEKPKPNENEASYLLNLPVSLKDKLTEIAKKNDRTLKGQIVHFLNNAVKEIEKSETAPLL